MIEELVLVLDIAEIYCSLDVKQ